jgi:hypothetical protein
MPELAEIFVAAVLATQDPKQLAERVAEMRARYFQPFCFPSSDERLLARVLNLVRQVMSPNSFDALDEMAALHVAARV